MQEQMVLEIRVLGKSSRANMAFERPRSAVHVHVGFEIAGRRERFRAQAAFVRFFLKRNIEMSE